MNMMVSAAIAGTALVPDLASAAPPTPAAPAKTDRRALEAYAAWLQMERRLPRRAINIIKLKNAVHLVNGWRVLGWFGPACCNAFSSISQVELHTQALRYFFGAPLKSERITLRKNNCRLPTEGMVASNSDVEMI